MNDTSKPNKKPTKAEKQQLAREKAQTIRQQQEKKEKRTKLFLKLGVLASTIIVALIITIVVVQNNKPAGPPPNNLTAKGGVAFTANNTVLPTDHVVDHQKQAEIVVYLDFICPACKSFETQNAELINSWVDADLATIEYRPISILDRASLGTNYSSRSVNAAACLINEKPAALKEFVNLLFVNQPAEGSQGLDNNTLNTYVKQAGVTNAESCIKNGQFRGWVADTSRNFTTDGFTGTPTVLVNGEQWKTGDFPTFAQTAAGEVKLPKPENSN